MCRLLGGEADHLAQEIGVAALLNELAEGDPVVGHRGGLRLWLLVATQPYRRSRDGHPLWIAGLPTPDSWRSLRQATYPQLLHDQPGRGHATFVAFGTDAVYAPPRGEPVPLRVVARRPDTIVGFGDTRIRAETSTFEPRASEVANPRPGDQLSIDGDTFTVQGEPERRDPDRLVWTLDVRG